MQDETAPVIRVKWQFSAVEGEREASYTGFESKVVLADLFALWLKDQGDVSGWEQATRFANIVHTYSTLTARVIAVWLGIEPLAIYEQARPGAPPWRLRVPDGTCFELTRTMNRKHDSSN